MGWPSGLAERVLKIMENRELTMDDYLAMLRRRMKVILIPALLAPLAGFLVSYGFPAKYTSQSEVLVSPPRIPEAVVQSVFSEDLTQHITTIQQRVLSPTLLRPMVERLGLAKEGQNVEDVISNIQPNMTIQAVPDISDFGHGQEKAWYQPRSRLLRELHRIDCPRSAADMCCPNLDGN